MGHGIYRPGHGAARHGAANATSTTQISHPCAYTRLVKFEAINREALTALTKEIAIAELGEPNRRLSGKRELRFGRKGSLAVVIEGPRAGQWYDHENCRGGDIIALIQHVREINFRDAITYVGQSYGSARGVLASLARPPRGPARTDIREKERRAGELWREAVPIAGTIAERYLARRGVLAMLARVDGRVLRFHPACPFGEIGRIPCMLMIMRDIHNNEPRAIYRTGLTPTAGKIGRMALGSKSGSAAKLSSDEDVTQGLAVGEGLETVLSAMQLGFLPAWVLGDAGGVRDFPVLSGIDCITLIVDNDENGAGPKAALECSRRWTEAGREVFRVIPDRSGEDMNEVVQRALR